MRGILLAGGTGSRLHPTTRAVCKQLLPVYDKPMIFYPLSVLMLAGIREILVISTPEALPAFRALLGDGADLGIELQYAEQDRPRGIADALVVGRDFVGDDDVALVLGDNLFHGAGFSDVLAHCRATVEHRGGAVLVGHVVADPARYGVAAIDDDGRLTAVVEKPADPPSDVAVTGLYFYGNDVLDVAADVEPSARGELEITDVNAAYVRRGTAELVTLGRGFAWLDTGTHASLLDAAQYVAVVESRHGVRIACPEEIALRMGFISPAQARRLGELSASSDYGRYVVAVADQADRPTPTVLEAV
ncbi:glucose-1-phosphate thymidylyltransferase RfbA [Actinomycetospora termitidis]|uniref:Glucose-1-phosphate thymidylyltransferase n=1 Tax=Actinomycetospora termitidis TaxID=3053470 RepID=A0ABT7MD50_9PSEU|nr:glucose-1-phosphate thymidylyltransferase RfbA [Actinomycetospora sp. Odt1-22]MDL5158590.1 glucose-1-phosphate thymidylyltransferase RfbA [Actinomycetospora sp. Odt1-22]